MCFGSAGLEIGSLFVFVFFFAWFVRCVHQLLCVSVNGGCCFSCLVAVFVDVPSVVVVGASSDVGAAVFWNRPNRQMASPQSLALIFSQGCLNLLVFLSQ